MIFWILIGILLAGLFYWKLIKPHQYWTNKGVKQGKQHILIGDSLGTFLRKQSFAEFVQHVYNKIPDVRYSGMYQFQMATLVLRDPELIKQITIKDFDHFTDHVTVVPDDYEPLWSRNLFALTGDKWRDMRATLSPSFTSSKMKTMFSLMSECSEQFTEYLEKDPPKSIELKDLFTRFTNDVIATCAFGIKCDSLKERDNEFYLMGKEATDFTGIWRMWKFVLFLAVPKVVKFFGITLFSKKVSDFFNNLVADTVKMREEKNIIRPDMINLLMQARKGQLVYDEQNQHSKETGFATVEEFDVGKVAVKHKQEITDLDMTAQALIFFFAGFDSVSTLMCFVGYELAVNPDIQERLHLEIVDTLNSCGGNINYEAINKMKYLDMIISETLRKWPAAAAIDRVCTEPYTIKAQNSGEVDLHFNKGDVLWVPIYGIHHDPQYFPNPNKFDPERFNDENKGNIKQYTYMPFGVGPRNCIGSRFALLETKVVFVTLLSKMELVVVDKTPIPLILSKKGFNMNADDGFWVGLKPRSK